MSRLAPGAQLGPYRVIELLGAGGMGEVYRAQDTRLGRTVALKLLPEERSLDPERRQRMLQEARTVSALNHPHILGLHDLAEADGQQFLVLEYVAGRTLDQVIPRHGLPLEDAVRYAVQIASALAAAHEAGVIHRDLKPGNIMVTDKGAVKLLDFGLAKMVQPVAAVPVVSGETATMLQTEPGMVLGTVNYMSPEQAEGKPVDARSDIFSFGCVLHEMLTGKRAFQGNSPASVLSAVLRDEPAPVDTLRPETPYDLRKIVTRCLRKDSKRRFQDADDLKVALLEVQEELGTAAPDSATAARSKPRRWMLVAAGVAILAVIAAGAFLYRRMSPGETPLAVSPLTAYPGYELEPALSPDGNQVAFEWEGDRRDNSDIYVKLIGAGEPLRLTTDPARDHSPAWSPDGRWIAFVRERSNDRSAVILVPALGGAERIIAETASSPFHEARYLGSRALTWTVDGRQLVVSDRTADSGPLGLFLLSLETGDKRRLTSPVGPVLSDRNPAFSPNGRLLAFSRTLGMRSADLCVLSLSGDLRPEGDPKLLTQDHYGNGSPTWLDNRELVFSSSRDRTETLWRMRADGPGPVSRLPLAGNGSASPAFSRASHRLAYAQRFLDANIWSVAVPDGTGAPTAPRMLVASSRLETDADFSPDGRRIVFQSDRSGNLEIWVSDIDGSHSRELTSFGHGDPGSPRWSPDGTQIAFDSKVDGLIQIYVIGADGGPPKRLTEPPGSNFVPSWSRDGQWIYFASFRTGRTEIWKIPARGGPAIQIAAHNGGAVRESADGRALYYEMEDSRVLWRKPLDGGPEQKLVDSVWMRGWAVAEQGIYYMRANPGSGWSIHFLNLSTHADTRISELTKPPMLGLSLSPDRRTLLYTQIDDEGSDLMLIENFR
jgi:Tol biopolymer transport system component